MEECEQAGWACECDGYVCVCDGEQDISAADVSLVTESYAKSAAHMRSILQGLSRIDFDSHTAPAKDKVDGDTELSRIYVQLQLGMSCRESVGKVGFVALGVGSWGGGVMGRWWDIITPCRLGTK
jgi:hypothetical protein